MVEVWKALAVAGSALLVIVILLAVLIPRAVPCSDHPPKIDKVLQSYPSPLNESQIWEAELLCFADAASSGVKVHLFGDFLITGPKSGSSWGKDPDFYWNGGKVDGTTSSCRDLKVWMRPGVYSCQDARFTAPVTNATNVTSIVSIAAEVREPCEVKRKSVTVTAISTQALALNITGVTPSRVCIGVGDTNTTVMGQGFLFWRKLKPYAIIPDRWNTPTVFYQNALVNQSVDPQLQSCQNRTLSTSFPTEVLVCQNFSVLLPRQDNAPNGPDNLTVVNAGPCVASIATIRGAVNYTAGTVRVFAAAPDIIYDGVAFQITIYTSGLGGTNTVRNVRVTNNQTERNFTADPSSNPNQVKVSIPSTASTNGLPPGTYDIVVEAVEDPVGCSGRLVAGLTVIDQSRLTVTITSVQPQYIWQLSSATAITVTAKGGLIDTPAMYVSLSGVSATPVSAVSFLNNNTVNGVLRVSQNSLQPGVYDLIIINPDRSVGVLSGALQIVATPPPIITLVSPDSVPGAAIAATITGMNFDNSSLRLDCVGTAGNLFSVNLTVRQWSATIINTTWPAGNVGDFCVVVVINIGGVEGKYSGVSFKGTSLNLLDFQSGVQMTRGRRGNAVALTRPTEADRYLLAIGGDGSTSTGYLATNMNATNTVESVPIDRLGTMGTWALQRNTLPTPCTYTDARTVSFFVYVLCGHDGTAPTNKIYRALVLDPLQTPELNLDITVDETASGSQRGLFASGGQFVYRVSALFPAGDASNPNGESLPSEPLSLKLPVFPGVNGTFVLNISWDAIPGASSYRVYRTVDLSAPTAIGHLLDLDATVGCNARGCALLDHGTGVAPDPSVVPYPPGSLGMWHATSAMLTPRAWGAMADSPQPGITASNTHYLYVFGGISGVGAGDSGALNTFELATITITPSSNKTREAQTVTPWTAGGSNMQSARYNIMATTMDPSLAPNLALPLGSYYIHVGPGNGVGGGILEQIEVADVPANGSIALQATSNPSPGARQGACMFSYTGSLGELGFVGGRSSDRGVGGELPGSGSCAGVACLLTYGNWNSGWGFAPNPSDVKCIKVKPFVYLAGGVINNQATPVTGFNFV